MSDVKHVQPTADSATGKRRGSVFNTLAHVMRDVRELIFTTGFIMRNRPGLNKVGSASTGFVPVNNMFEAYYDKESADKVNGIIIGRMGDGDKRNTNLVELCATSQPGSKNLELGYNNGAVKLRVTRAGENPPVDRTGVTVSDPNTLGPDQPAGVTVHIVGQGSYGGVVLSHVADKSDSPTTGASGGRRIMILDDGIYIRNLPTSSAGLLTGALWSNGGVLTVV